MMSYKSFIFFILTFMIFLSYHQKTSYASSILSFSEAESWVIERIQNGEIADLNKFSPKGNDRILSATFLERLLTRKIGELENTFSSEIRNVTFTEPIIMFYEEIDFAILFSNCQFNETVNFSRCHFKKFLGFENSSFLKNVDFHRMRSDYDVEFTRISFHGDVNLKGASINGELISNFGQYNQKAIFNNIKVVDNAEFNETIFKGSVDFIGANINGDFLFRNAQLLNNEIESYFNGIQVAGNLDIKESLFICPVSFAHIKIGKNFFARRTRFLNSTNKTTFNGMKVEGLVTFNYAIFAGGANFVGGKINGEFQLHECQFYNSSNGVSFQGIQILGSLIINKTTFECPADFSYARIGNLFDANNTQFLNPNHKIDFTNLSVQGVAFFSNANFMGPAQFINTKIGGEFIAKKANFLNSDSMTTFSAMEVQGIATFDNAIFNGPVDFLGTIIKGELHTNESIFYKNVRFNKMSVDIPIFRCLTIKGSYCLNGMIFQSIDVGDEEGKCEKVLSFLNKAEYSADVYARLEDFYKLNGYQETANKVFITFKRRERWDGNLPFLMRMWSDIKYYLIGYGRRIEQSIYISIFFIILGSFILRKEIMTKSRSQEKVLYFNCFWYSVDLFLPFIDLKMEKNWIPNPDLPCIWLLRLYMCLHIISGWFLIPIGLAAFTGIIE